MKTIWVLTALLIFVCGCRHPRARHGGMTSVRHGSVALNTVNFTNRISPDWLQPPTAPFTLRPGDRLEIEIIGDRSVIRTLSGQPSYIQRMECTGAMPRNPADFQFLR